MRYERLDWTLSTAACDLLQTLIECQLGFHDETPIEVRNELVNCANELRSRLQHTDPDPQVETLDPLLA